MEENFAVLQKESKKTRIETFSRTLSAQAKELLLLQKKSKKTRIETSQRRRHCLNRQWKWLQKRSTKTRIGTSNLLEKGLIQKRSPFGKVFFFKETFMTHRDTHEHENNKVFSYQRIYCKKSMKIRIETPRHQCHSIHRIQLQKGLRKQGLKHWRLSELSWTWHEVA